jgi:hypothetical protein
MDNMTSLNKILWSDSNRYDQSTVVLPLVDRSGYDL